MIRKSGNRFSEKDHASPKSWSANRFDLKRLGSRAFRAGFARLPAAKRQCRIEA
jgi:hypothetical protein